MTLWQSCSLFICTLHQLSKCIEQQSLEFVRDTLSPLLISWEQELQYQLFTEEEIEIKKYYFKFNLNSLLRGDSTNRASYYKTMHELGVYSINEIRELEDKDKIKNGDKHYMSLNYIDIDLMNEYQKQKVKMKDTQESKQEDGDKPPDNNQENPNENINKDDDEGGGNDGEESQGN